MESCFCGVLPGAYNSQKSSRSGSNNAPDICSQRYLVMSSWASCQESTMSMQRRWMPILEQVPVLLDSKAVGACCLSALRMESKPHFRFRAASPGCKGDIKLFLGPAKRPEMFQVGSPLLYVIFRSSFQFETPNRCLRLPCCACRSPCGLTGRQTQMGAQHTRPGFRAT